MKVILLDNIRGIGRVGDVKEVSDGYARNFLIVRGKAKAATEGAAREAEVSKAQKLESMALAKEEAKVLAKKLSGMRIELSGKANPKGKLFSGITAATIAERVSALAGAHIAPAQLRLKEPLKTTGDHTLVLELADGLTTNVVIAIIAQN